MHVEPGLNKMKRALLTISFIYTLRAFPKAAPDAGKVVGKFFNMC